MMSKKTENEFPPDWDDDRVREVLDYYESQTDEEAAVEDDQAFEDSTQTTMEVPIELVPAVRELIARHQQQRDSSG